MSPWGATGAYRRRAPVVATPTALYLDADADGDLGFTTTSGDQDHTFARAISEEDHTAEAGVLGGSAILEDGDGDVALPDSPVSIP